MKRRRNATASCVECEMDFASNRSLEKHLRSQNHEQRMLPLRNLSWLDFQEQSETMSEGRFNQEINSSQHLPDDDCFSEDMREYQDDEDNLHEPIDERPCSDDEQDGNEFYPFPSEMFFLLYCYTHGIMRSKVNQINLTIKLLMKFITGF